ncbi:vegetative cell wall protein gp1-like [Tripterygium wilfordii]|uniref:vegetative cell wall protein gp1-like n=1 Tax=Tripterygium wilfordii TaxID=458696 RepID=UPI0018F80616|nr:vegetative cell wall protein gp1-like [Tripterygium wilfordii]
MRGFGMMSWFFIVLFLSFTFNSPVEAKHGRKLVPAVVVGAVYCDTCFQEDFSKSSHFIPGASVAVECRDGNSRPSFRREVTTDKHGEFRVHLPFSVAKHGRKIIACSVKLIKSSEPNCAVASMAASSSLHLKSRKEGTHIFSAGFFTFRPQKQPNLCSQEPSLQNSRKLNSQKTSFPPISDPTFPPPLEDPTTPDLPPLGQTHLPPLPLIPKLPPLPELPPFPPLPGLSKQPPMPGNAAETKPGDDKLTNPEFFFPTPPLFPPNPFQPPPILPPNPFQLPPLLPPLPFQPPPLIPFPPNPLQPPPAPPIPLPPNPFQPPSAPLIPLLPIPGLTPPPPPPPPPPAFPFPLPPFPPFPFPPPGPGIPPASSSKTSSP